MALFTTLESWPVTMLFNSRFVARTIIDDGQDVSHLTAAMDAVAENKSVASWKFGFHTLNVQATAHPDNGMVPYQREAIARCNHHISVGSDHSPV